MATFNPIKVLFLRGGVLVFLAHTHFQSYQGSIFTGVGNTERMRYCAFQSYQGSIFTQRHLKEINQDDHLSILSRFYFYSTTGAAVALPSTFQSYQGSIFTGNWQIRTGYGGSFNPIKVLFLQIIKKRFSKTTQLSILSRFYFYNVVKKPKVRKWTSFNPIKVLFLHDVM